MMTNLNRRRGLSLKDIDPLYLLLIIAVLFSPRLSLGDLIQGGSKYVSLNMEDAVVATLLLRWVVKSGMTHLATVRLIYPKIAKFWFLVTTIFGLGLVSMLLIPGSQYSQRNSLIGFLFYLKWIEAGLLFLLIQSETRLWTYRKVRLHLKLFIIIAIIIITNFIIIRVMGHSTTIFIIP